MSEYKLKSGDELTIELRDEKTQQARGDKAKERRRGALPVDDETPRYLRRPQGLTFEFFDLGTRLNPATGEYEFLPFEQVSGISRFTINNAQYSMDVLQWTNAARYLTRGEHLRFTIDDAGGRSGEPLLLPAISTVLEPFGETAGKPHCAVLPYLGDAFGLNLSINDGDFFAHLNSEAEEDAYRHWKRGADGRAVLSVKKIHRGAKITIRYSVLLNYGGFLVSSFYRGFDFLVGAKPTGMANYLTPRLRASVNEKPSGFAVAPTLKGRVRVFLVPSRWKKRVFFYRESGSVATSGGAVPETDHRLLNYSIYNRVAGYKTELQARAHDLSDPLTKLLINKTFEQGFFWQDFSIQPVYVDYSPNDSIVDNSRFDYAQENSELRAIIVIGDTPYYVLSGG